MVTFLKIPIRQDSGALIYPVDQEFPAWTWRTIGLSALAFDTADASEDGVRLTGTLQKIGEIPAGIYIVEVSTARSAGGTQNAAVFLASYNDTGVVVPLPQTGTLIGYSQLQVYDEQFTRAIVNGPAHILVGQSQTGWSFNAGGVVTAAQSAVIGWRAYPLTMANPPFLSQQRLFLIGRLDGGASAANGMTMNIRYASDVGSSGSNAYLQLSSLWCPDRVVPWFIRWAANYPDNQLTVSPATANKTKEATPYSNIGFSRTWTASGSEDRYPLQLGYKDFVTVQANSADPVYPIYYGVCYQKDV